MNNMLYVTKAHCRCGHTCEKDSPANEGFGSDCATRDEVVVDVTDV